MASSTLFHILIIGLLLAIMAMLFFGIHAEKFRGTVTLVRKGGNISDQAAAGSLSSY
jgi:hypothetical protein